MGLSRHRHLWCENDTCVSCGARRCQATQLRSAILLQTSRCRRATQEGSSYCRRHRYLDRVRSKKLVEALPLQAEPQPKVP